MSDAADDKMVVQMTRGELRLLMLETAAEAVKRAGAAPARSPWVNVEKAAKHFGCTPQTIRNWIRDGAPGQQVGTSARSEYRVDLEEMDAWVRAQRPKLVAVK